MRNRIKSIFVLLLVGITCIAIGLFGCADSDSKNAKIVIRTDSMEISMAVFSDFTTPIAGVFDENLDRIDGKTIVTSVYNPSGALVEESTEQIKFRLISRGTWKVVYTAYNGETKDENIPQSTLTVYSCGTLATPSEFSVSNNTLTWEKVPSAVEYEVSVNGAEPITVKTESFTSDVFDGSGYYVAVKAKGDNKKWLDSSVGAYKNRTPLKEGELMAFNDCVYELDVVQAFDTWINMPPDQIEWLSEEECEGSNSGAIKFRIRSGDSYWSVFRLNVMDGVALDTNDDWEYLEMRFKIDTAHYMDTTARKTYLTTSGAYGHSNNVNIGMYLTADNNDQWLVYRVEKSKIAGRYLTTDKSSVGREYTGIGYKKYEIEPVYSATFENNVVAWNKVEGAYGYKITVTRSDGKVKTYTDYSNDGGYTVGAEENYSFDITTDTAFYDASLDYTVLIDAEKPTNHSSICFNIYNLVSTIGRADVYIDYVRLCKEESAAPENLRYSDGKILWDAVPNTQNYTLNLITYDQNGNADSTYYSVAGDKTEFDLASIGFDANSTKFVAEISATPADAYKLTSAWTCFETLDNPTNFSINKDSGVLSWDAVANADSYEIKVGNKVLTTDTNSLNVSTYLTGDVMFYVKAMGIGYIDSGYSGKGSFTLTGSQIATFNNSVYESLISTLPNGVQGSVGATVVEKATYLSESDCEGSNGGAVEVVIKPKLAGRQSDFVVTLPETINMSGKSSISVRVKVTDISYYTNRAADAKWYLRVISSAGTGYSSSTTDPRWAREIPVIGEWVTLTWEEQTFSNGTVKLLDGYSSLTFSLVTSGAYSNDLKGFVKICVDDISYCQALETPNNLVISGTTLSWDAVANATGYVVDVNGTEIPVSSTSVDLASYLTSDATIKVKATSAGYIDSDYAIKNVISLTGNQIATFNSAAYENMISTLPNGVQGSVGATIVESVKYLNESECEGSNGGAVEVVIKPKLSGRQADFVVTLPKETDMTGKTSISVRIKVTDTSYYTDRASDAKWYLRIISSAGTGYSSSTTDPRWAQEISVIGEWVTLTWTEQTFSSGTVSLLDGYSTLTFSLVTSGAYSNNLTNGRVKLYIDDISYNN